jgi:hypothetical protein
MAELIQEISVLRLKSQHELFKLISIHCKEFEIEMVLGIRLRNLKELALDHWVSITSFHLSSLSSLSILILNNGTAQIHTHKPVFCCVPGSSLVCTPSSGSLLRCNIDHEILWLTFNNRVGHNYN